MNHSSVNGESERWPLSPNPSKLGFCGLWTEKFGRPKNADPMTTDPTPHSRPSDEMVLDSEFYGNSCRFLDPIGMNPGR